MMTDPSPRHPAPHLRPSILRRIAAWSVHTLTASSAVWGLLAMRALLQQDWVEMFAWLVVTVVIDGIDGTLARIARVKEVLPHFDGALPRQYRRLPDVRLRAGGLPVRLRPHAARGDPARTALVVMSSAYQFSQSDAKTADYFFLGFPSYWNIVALYLFFLAWILGRILPWCSCARCWCSYR
jgi:phosphatidylcholine synthase